MTDKKKGLLVFSLVILLAILIGNYILTATFFGILMLLGLVVLIESIPPLKWLVSKMSRTLDVIIFTLTILAMTGYGLNVSAALTIAGLGYTLVYAPHLREKARQKPRRVIRDRRQDYDWK